MKTWIFILLVLASASGIVSAHVAIPGDARHIVTHSTATD